MKRIGLLSDTHAYWDDRYLQHFESCDEIWHAGDIGSLELAMKLNEFRPLKAVFGNCDGGDLRRLYTEKLRWTCEGADVLMTHIGGYPGHYDPRIRAQISGHSHILKVQYDERLGLLHINPGAAGLQGWHQVRTLVRFTIENASFSDLEIIEIPR